MNRFFLCLIVASTASLATAQTSAQGQSGAATAWPKPTANPKEAQAMRLEILNAERSEINKKLSEAMTTLPKSADMPASLNGISRLQNDLMAIDREIANAEGRDRKGAASTEARKPAATAAGGVATDQGQLVEATQANVEYQAWDVFKNFGK
jgi:hypothetical protein